jgi:hypothetical protein
MCDVLSCKYCVVISIFVITFILIEIMYPPEHLSSPLVFSGVRVTRSLVLCELFVDRCLSFFF